MTITECSGDFLSNSGIIVHDISQDLFMGEGTLLKILKSEGWPPKFNSITVDPLPANPQTLTIDDWKRRLSTMSHTQIGQCYQSGRFIYVITRLAHSYGYTNNIIELGLSSLAKYLSDNNITEITMIEFASKTLIDEYLPNISIKLYPKETFIPNYNDLV